MRTRTNENKIPDYITAYELKYKDVRESVDLRFYKQEIVQAVHKVLGKNVNVEVEERYYTVSKRLSHGEAIAVGRSIVDNTLDLAKRVKHLYSKSGRSGQLFRRMEKWRENYD